MAALTVYQELKRDFPVGSMIRFRDSIIDGGTKREGTVVKVKQNWSIDVMYNGAVRNVSMSNFFVNK